MQLSYSWLASFVDVTDSLDDLESTLTNIGLEVEFIEDRRFLLENIVVAEIRSCEKHPNADKLSVCVVFDGTDSYQVVCGAPNAAAGQKVIFARVGSTIPASGISIESRSVRGVQSVGMICSTAELGLDDDHSGIAVLDASAELGVEIAQYLHLDDVHIGIGITPNRGDALSHLGVARDLAAVACTRVRLPENSIAIPQQVYPFSITIQDVQLCPRYSAAIIEGVSVSASPPWLASKLRACGIRPINNIVDATNYVMLEMGQPMHAFDLSVLSGDTIIVRTAGEGESLTTLDGEERTAPTGALLICDAEKPVAVAGVMGGEESAVTAATVDVLLESAYFNASSVRRTARLMALSTDSSYRFERGTDPEATVIALRRATSIILQIAGGSLSGIYDEYAHPILPRQVRLRPQRTCAILGVDIPTSEQQRILEALGIVVEQESDTHFLCRIPTFRSDLEREVDLIEEIARIFGYDNIPVPTKTEMHVANHFDEQRGVETLRSIVLGLGFDEIMSSSLVPKSHAALGGEQFVEVRNPVSKERPALRAGLLPSLLEAINLNIRNGSASLRIFEIGKVFSASSTNDFEERNMLGMAVTGLAHERNWYAPERRADLFDLKGAVETFMDALHLDSEAIFCYDRSSTLSDAILTLEVKGSYIGQLVEVSETILAMFDIDQQVWYAEFDIEALRGHREESQRYNPVARFPSVIRDLAIVVANSVRVKDIEDSVFASAPPELRKLRVIDVFTSDVLGTDKKSVAFTMTFRADDRTMKDEEIQAAVTGIVDALRREVQAELRA